MKIFYIHIFTNILFYFKEEQTKPNNNPHLHKGKVKFRKTQQMINEYNWLFVKSYIPSKMGCSICAVPLCGGFINICLLQCSTFTLHIFSKTIVLANKTQQKNPSWSSLMFNHLYYICILLIRNQAGTAFLSHQGA